MAVSLASIGTTSVATTSPLSTPYPASIASTELLLHLVASKFISSAHTTPSGFDFLDTDTAGNGAEDGSDRGSVVASAFDRIADGSETGNLSTTWTGLTGGSVAQGIIARITRSGGSGFEIATTTARWTTNDTNPISVTFDDAIDFAPDDYCVIFYGNNANNPSNLTPASLTASGITFGSLTTQRFTSTSEGGDMAIAYVDAVVSSGSGTVAPSFQASKNASAVGEGPLIFIRIREATGGSPPAGIVTITDVDPGETTATPTWTIDDATGVDDYEARVDGGTPFSIGTTSPAVDAITGLTAATDYDTPGLEIRAVNAFGAGDWSAAFPFSTDNPGGGGGEVPAEALGVTLEATASLIPGAVTGQSNATAAAALLTATASLLAGTVSGQINATAVGATLTATAALIAGAATGQANATATAAVLPASASLLPGAATGQSTATAAGATLTATAALLAGAATGQLSATASAVLLTATASLLPGTAGGGVAATATGATLQAAASLVGGAASGQSNATALGSTFTATASLVLGTVSGAASATAAGVTLSAQASLLPGLVSGPLSAVAEGAVLTATVVLLPGTAGLLTFLPPAYVITGRLPEQIVLRSRVAPQIVIRSTVPLQ